MSNEYITILETHILPLAENAIGVLRATKFALSSEINKKSLPKM